MKRLFLLFVILLPMITMAQTYKFQTNSFSYKYYNERNGRWTDWSDWSRSSMLVVISLDRAVINIYSEAIQEYDIIDYQGETKDSEGGKSMQFLCVNEDGLRCNIRLRQQRDGQKQLYVDFKDMMWVYSITDK